jgi:hypothetical protein
VLQGTKSCAIRDIFRNVRGVALKSLNDVLRTFKGVVMGNGTFSSEPQITSGLSSTQPILDASGNPVHNHILLGLSQEDLNLLLPRLEHVRFRLRHVLHEAGDNFEVCLFCK